MKIFTMVSLLSVLGFGGCSYGQKIQGFAFATEQMQGNIMVDEGGLQLPPARLVQRIVYIFLPKGTEGELVADSMYYQDKAIDFSIGETTNIAPELYLKGGKHWQPAQKMEGKWFPFYVSFAEHAEQDSANFKLPVKIVGSLNGKPFVVKVKQEIWLEAMPAQ